MESTGLAGSVAVPAYVPHYQFIIDDITARIASGALPPGAKLGSTPELAVEYHVSPGTVRRAVELLIDRGTLRGHQGLGVFVPEVPTKS